MQFKGTFQVFPKLEEFEEMDRDVRKLLKGAFYQNVLNMLVDIAIRVPVLTGTTRAAIMAACDEIDRKLASQGIQLNTSRLDSIDLEMTNAKESTEDTPDHWYGSPYKAPVHGAGLPYGKEGRVHSREEWRDKLAVYHPTETADNGAAFVDSDVYRGFGNISKSTYTYYFGLNSRYWKYYDVMGVADWAGKEHGPWHMMPFAEKLFNERMTVICNGISRVVATRIEELFDGGSLKTVGTLKARNYHLI